MKWMYSNPTNKITLIEAIVIANPLYVYTLLFKESTSLSILYNKITWKIGVTVKKMTVNCVFVDFQALIFPFQRFYVNIILVVL